MSQVRLLSQLWAVRLGRHHRLWYFPFLLRQDLPSRHPHPWPFLRSSLAQALAQALAAALRHQLQCSALPVPLLLSRSAVLVLVLVLALLLGVFRRLPQ
jgi:hypothetical protein